MPSKEWKLCSEAKSYCSTASCGGGSLLNHPLQFHGGLFRFDTLHVKDNSGKPVCQQNKGVADLGPLKYFEKVIPAIDSLSCRLHD